MTLNVESPDAASKAGEMPGLRIVCAQCELAIDPAASDVHWQINQALN